MLNYSCCRIRHIIYQKDYYNIMPRLKPNCRKCGNQLLPLYLRNLKYKFIPFINEIKGRVYACTQCQNFHFIKIDNISK